MRYLVLTDIHANLEALDVCLVDARARTFDQVLVLGDLIGYGADPNAVIDRVRALNPVALVRGNHDKVSSGLESADGFNAIARAAAEWTSTELTEDNRRWIARLPHGPVIVDADIEICHGSPVDEDEYIFGQVEARSAFTASTRPICLFGHTHYPAVFEYAKGTLEGTRVAMGLAPELHLLPGVKYLINPGSVGQPRDGDPRTAYAIVDVPEARVELVRLDYPVKSAQKKIRLAGLPGPLADRLAAGR
jgi:predicted phosphodiesterase